MDSSDEFFTVDFEWRYSGSDYQVERLVLHVRPKPTTNFNADPTGADHAEHLQAALQFGRSIAARCGHVVGEIVISQR